MPAAEKLVIIRDGETSGDAGAQSGEGDHCDILIQGVFIPSGIYDPKMLEIQTFYR